MANPQLLILDSDPQARAQLTKLLSESYDLHIFEYSEEAVHSLDSHFPDVCLLSISPSVNSVIAHIQSHSLSKWTSIILLADPQHLNDPNYQALLASHDYVLKPIIIQDLSFRLKKCLTVPKVDGLLLTEDEDIRLQCDAALSKEGFGMIQVNHFSRFLSLISRSTYKFLIVDTRVAGFQSEAFFLELSEWRAVVPQLLVIAPAIPPQSSTAALIARADDFITLPFTAVDLCARLHRICSHFAHHGLLISSTHQDTSSLENWLSKVGIKLHLPGTLDQTLVFLETGNYDIIFWDAVQLPENASELLATIQRLHPTIPILFICTSNELESHTKLILKATDYVISPLNEERFLLRLQRLLNTNATPTETVIQPIQDYTEDAAAPAEISATPNISVFSPVELSMGEREALMDQIRVGLNHEIRNPLTSILIGAQALNRRFAAHSEERDIIVEIEKAAKRIKNILNAMGNMEKYIVEDYVGNIKMLSFSERKHD